VASLAAREESATAALTVPHRGRSARIDNPSAIRKAGPVSLHPLAEPTWRRSQNGQDDATERRIDVDIKHARGALAAALVAAGFAATFQAGVVTAGESDAAVPRAGATTLLIEDPDGNAFRLVHVDGAGWKYAAAKPAEASRSMFRKVALESKSEPQPKAADVPADEPLTVFIDGPSGFTYVWNRDAGWTFVGKLSARRP